MEKNKRKNTSKLKFVVWATGGFSILLGLLVIVGWAAGNKALIQVLPSFVPMQFNSSLGFLLSGITLILLQQFSYKAGRIIAVSIGIIGLLTLVEYGFQINLGIDELIVKHNITIQTSHPGRMAPNTALCFVLSALSMLLTVSGHRNILYGGVIGSMVFGLGVVAFIGYLVGMEITYGWGELTRMAVHTSLGFMILGVGLTFLSLYKEKVSPRHAWKTLEPSILGYTISLSLMVFFIDLSLPLGYAIGSAYIFLILPGWFIKQKRVTLWLAFGVSMLTVIGFFLSQDGHSIQAAVTNRILSITSIWLVAILLDNIKRKNIINERLNSKIHAQLHQLETQNRELKEFTYIASHDLQEPVRTVLSYIDLLDQEYADKITGLGSKYLKFIQQASVRMSDLIKALLDYSRIGQDIEQTVVDCNQLMRNICKDLGVAIDESKATLNIDDLPSVTGYEQELRALFQNLLANAIKFRKKDTPPVININAIQNGHYWRFAIQDNGIGIPSSHRVKIFKIFQRLHARHDFEGTGIGLAQCRKIIDNHGGQIWVESDENQGSTFFFTIPYGSN